MLKKLFSLFYLIKRSPCFLILDIGTTNLKILIIDEELKIQEKKEKKNKIFSPEQGFFEENPATWFFEIKKNLEKMVRQKNIKAIGLTSQRETTIAWDKNTGMALSPAILWYDQRTKKTAQKFKKKNNSDLILKKTGLFLHWRYPAFKIHWLLQNSKEVKQLIKLNRVVFGPPSSWLIYNLTKERNFLIDHTQASRSMLYNLKTNSWDKELLDMLQIRKETLPRIKPNFHYYGQVEIKQKKIPLLCSIGDQEASLINHPFQKGIAKLTLGTGIFFGQNIGRIPKINKEIETSVCFFDQNPYFMHEARLSFTGGKIFQALKEKDEKTLQKFRKELQKTIKLFSPQKIYVDGGLVRKDKLGIKARKILEETGANFVFPNQIEGTALGVAKILKKFNNK